MKVVVTIQHPAHVHFFRHAVREWQDAGHEVHVFAREKEMAVGLLEAFDIDHEVLAGSSDGLVSLAGVQATYEARLLRRALAIRPDVVTAIGGVAASHVATAVGARSVLFYDTEHAGLIQRLAYPFADAVYTPDCFEREVGDKQVRYDGYHELAYLHPDRFEPDPGVLDDVGLAPADDYVVCRLVDWGASHDVGSGGFGDVTDAVRRLEATGAEVLVTAEGDLPAELEDRRTRVAPEDIHDLLAYADLFVGEGATMAAESAVLGTPAVYVNTLSMGYTDDLASYGLLFQFDGEHRHREALRRAESLLSGRDSGEWTQRREAMLAEKRDTTAVLTRAVGRAGEPAADAGDATVAADGGREGP